MTTQGTFCHFLTPFQNMTRYNFFETFFGSKDTPKLEMSKIKAVANGYFMTSYFNIHWTPMGSIYWPRAFKICLKLTSCASECTCQISAIYNKNCGFFSITPKKKVIFWPKFKMPIYAVLPIRIQNAFNTKSLPLRGSYGKNLGRKLRPPWAAIFREFLTITVKWPSMAFYDILLWSCVAIYSLNIFSFVALMYYCISPFLAIIDPNQFGLVYS